MNEVLQAMLVGFSFILAVCLIIYLFYLYFECLESIAKYEWNGVSIFIKLYVVIISVFLILTLSYFIGAIFIYG
jgi:hypothetical protein